MSRPRQPDGTFKQSISDWEYYQDIRRVAQELGHAPMTEEYTEHGRYHWRSIYKRGLTWPEALERAGLDPDDREVRPRQELPAPSMNEHREYCERCGTAESLIDVTFGIETKAVCESCRETLERRASRSGVRFAVGGVDQ